MDYRDINLMTESSSEDRMHELSEDCWCEPEIEEVFDEDGRLINRLVIHREVH